MEKHFQDQVERIDRLMHIVEASNPHIFMHGMLFYDVLIFACQSMWHLKDWIINDPGFCASDIKQLKDEVHSTRCLLVCSDIANGTKHLSLKYPKSGSRIFDRRGIHSDPSKGIYQEFYYIFSNNPADEFHGMEIRTLLRRCRDAWEHIIDRHYMSEVNAWLDK